ncbi:type II toxin-antitoxin system VapC family toxin [Acidisoma cladoniae]|uniref:type II toxin-antitoxin system VapC family toxin n=1 Tax=Acidisoma cladoniae TaxID=3040935 RepID=UPI00254E2483|nr:type II toxin-antitoxin system VapC family toxin [Acidisoma sp. PAMC 29798]
MIILDTNVISEVMKDEPNPIVLGWLNAMPPASLFVASVSQAELLYGIALLPAGKRRGDLLHAASIAFNRHFRGRVLPFDNDAAHAYAELASTRRQAGRPMTPFDAQIAAIARSRGAELATRNVPDFDGCGIVVINPWSLTS